MPMARRCMVTSPCMVAVLPSTFRVKGIRTGNLIFFSVSTPVASNCVGPSLNTPSFTSNTAVGLLVMSNQSPSLRLVVEIGLASVG